VEVAVQINGKLRGRINVPLDSDNETVLSTAKADDKVAQAIDGKTIVKEIVIKNKLVNIVVK
jgi:leucyl-tRNA synthetase